MGVPKTHLRPKTKNIFEGPQRTVLCDALYYCPTAEIGTMDFFVSGSHTSTQLICCTDMMVPLLKLDFPCMHRIPKRRTAKVEVIQVCQFINVANHGLIYSFIVIFRSLED